MDIRSSLAAQGYQSLRPATEPLQGTSETGASGLQALKSFQETLAAAEQAATTSMTGESDPHTLVHALAQAELAVETAVTVRNKVVEAYQEILRMPV